MVCFGDRGGPGWCRARSTIVKERVNSAPESILKPVAGGIGNILTFLTVVMLGVRVFTVQADSRYINDFPTTM